MAKVLFAGESWLNVTTHVKGFDLFTTSSYADGAKRVVETLTSAGHSTEYIASHEVPARFPTTLDELQQYQVVCLSDLSSDSLLLHPDTFIRSMRRPNRLKLLRDWVLGGGGLLMIGGYFSFQGIYARARWSGTPVEDVLPVTLETGDDRVEVPEGFSPRVVDPNHPVLAGLPGEWPYFLGYNRLKLRPEGTLLMTTETADPFLALREVGQGRTAAFASDCSPHWGSHDFLDWEYYERLWPQVVEWLAAER